MPASASLENGEWRPKNSTLGNKSNHHQRIEQRGYLVPLLLSYCPQWYRCNNACHLIQQCSSMKLAHIFCCESSSGEQSSNSIPSINNKQYCETVTVKYCTSMWNGSYEMFCVMINTASVDLDLSNICRICAICNGPWYPVYIYLSFSQIQV